MSDYVYIKESILSPDICQSLITLYESRPGKERFENDYKPQFTQVTLTPEESTSLLSIIQPTIQEYSEHYPFLPKTGNMELFRIKKYEPNTDDRFDWHCDSLGDSQSRYLAILMYLNTPDGGGNTEFQDLVVEPKEGSILIFPPFWTHPHRGLPVVGSTPKYIMSTYLRF